MGKYDPQQIGNKEVKKMKKKLGNNAEWQYKLGKIRDILGNRYAELHRELSRVGATQTSKINLVKDFEIIESQYQCLIDAIRHMERETKIAIQRVK